MGNHDVAILQEDKQGMNPTARQALNGHVLS
jgi:hypothetical protein